MIYFRNSLFTLILSEFNTRSSVWGSRDKTTIEGTQLEFLTAVHEFHQLILQPTHLLPQTLSCIDLIVDSRIPPTLH